MQEIVYKKFTLINVVFTFCTAMVASLLAPYLEKIGFLNWQISLMYVIFPLVSIIILPFIGTIADKFSKRFVIWIGIWMQAIALLLYLADKYWTVIVLARLFDGLAAAVVTLIILAKIEGALGHKQRARKTGWSLSFIYLGELIGPLAGAYLADYFFIQFPFLISVLILIVLSFFIFGEKEIKFANKSKKAFKYTWVTPLKLFFKHKNLKGMGILGMVMHATNPAMKIFLPLLIIDQLGMTYKAIGIAMFFYSITHVLQGFFGNLSDSIGHWKIVITGTLIYAITLILVYFTASYWILVLILFIMGMGGALWNVSAWSLMSEIGVKKKIEGQIVTSYFTFAKFGALISYLMSALVVKFFGIQSIFMLNGLIILLGIALSYKFFYSKQ